MTRPTVGPTTTAAGKLTLELISNAVHIREGFVSCLLEGLQTEMCPSDDTEVKNPYQNQIERF